MQAPNVSDHFSARGFVATIRAELAQAGRSDVRVERSWIGRFRAGHPLVMTVPIGTRATLTIRAAVQPSGIMDEGASRAAATTFAKALVNMADAEPTLIERLSDISGAVDAAIRAALQEGLDLQLVRTGFEPVPASLMTDEDLHEACLYVIPAVTIRRTSSHLRPECVTFLAEQRCDVEGKMRAIVAEQRARGARIATLEAIGADLLVDRGTLNLLEVHGLDVREILHRLAEEQRIRISVQHDGADVSIILINEEGSITSSVHLRDAVWNGYPLWFVGDEQTKGHARLVGEPVGALVRHPVFASRSVVDVARGTFDHLSFDLSEQFCFDAESGCIWKGDRLVA